MKASRRAQSSFDGTASEPLLVTGGSFVGTLPNASFARSSEVEMQQRKSASSRPATGRNADDNIPYKRSQLRLLRELKHLMEEKMTTDVFALFAAVLRKRAGPIDPSKGEQVLWDSMLRRKDLQIVGYSTFGLLLSIATTTMFWEFGGQRHTTLPEVTPDQLTLLYCSQLGMTLSTVVCMALIFQKYQLLLQSKRMEWASTSMYDLLQAEKDKTKHAEVQSRYLASYSFWRSTLRWKLAFELFVHLLHPLIWMNTDETKSVYEAFQILIFARLYLAVNVVFKFSQPYQRRREIVSNNLELQRTGFQPSVGGTLKMVFYDNPSKTTLVLLLATLAILGFIVFVTERSIDDENNPFRKLENSLWFAFVTFATVGYGDMAPVTAFGRLASVAIGAAGITTTTVFGGVVTNLMVQSREQRTVSQYLSETDADERVENSAARVIQLAFRYSRSKTKDIVNPWTKGGHKSNAVYGAIKDFKSYRWLKSQTQSSTNDPVTDAKINNVNALLSRSRRNVDQSRATVKSTRNAIRSFVSEMQSVLGSVDAGRARGTHRVASPSRASNISGATAPTRTKEL